MRAKDRPRFRWIVAAAAVGGTLVFAAVGSSAGGPRVPTLAFDSPIPVDYPIDYLHDGDAEGIAIGNLTGDTRPDLAIVSSEDSQVSVVQNKGRGRFKTVAAYDTPAPNGVAIADLNGDGKQDLVVKTQGNSVAVLLDRGDGTFSPYVDYPLGRGVDTDDLAVAFGDLNGDGKQDLVAVNGVEKSFAVLLNAGDGTFAAPTTYPTVAVPYGIALGDLTGDGKLDVAVPNYFARNVSVFAGAGDGTFPGRTNYRTGGRPQTVALADFNGDGRLDVATGNCCAVAHGVSVLLNRGGGQLAAARDYAAGDPSDPTLGVFLDARDVNRDHRPDLVYGSVRLNGGGGRFEPPLAGVGGALGDLNGDGRPDQAYATLDERNGSWGVWVELADPSVCDAQPNRGRKLAIAERVLRLANCRVGTISYAHSSVKWRGRVISQKPAGGAVLRKGAKVNLLVGSGPG